MLKTVLCLIMLNGVAISILGIWQQQLMGNKLYGAIAVAGAAPFGPFVNKNNAAGFLLASVGAALGLLLFSLASRKEARGTHLYSISTLRAVLESKSATMALLSSVVIICGLLFSMSRGGVVALFAGVLCTSILVLRGKNLGAALALIVFVSIASIAFVAAAGNWQPVSDRVSLAFDESRLAEDGRIGIWADCLHIVRDFWLTGTGLGTFSGVFRVYDSNPDGVIATHAENVLVQLACEGGLPLFLIAIAIFGTMFRSAIFMMVSQRSDIRALGTTWLFVLTTQLIASCFDFGLYIPALLYQLAFLTGVLSSQYGGGEEELQKDKVRRHKRNPLLSLMDGGYALVGRRFEFMVLGLVFLGIFGVFELTRASSLETLPQGSKQRSVAATTDGQTEFERLSRNIGARSDDSKAQYAIAEYYIRKFETELAKELPSGSVRELSSFVNLLQNGTPQSNENVRKLVDSRVVQANLKPALKHLVAARQSNPFDPSIHLRMFHLGFLQPPGVGNKDLDRTIRLLEGKRYEQFMKGLANFKSGKHSEAFACWKPCLENRSHYRSQIVSLALKVGTVDELLEEFFPRKKWFLLELANQHLTDPNQQVIRLRVLEMARVMKG